MSASVTSSTAELPEKFQRLTKEYLRVKDMCKVLRDGVNSERAKSEKLEYNLKEKEAQYRRLASEKEAIEFHNQQLTKRIELLMDELEKKPPVTKKKKLKPNEINVEELYNKIKILEDELCNKLHLNEELINKISDLESRESSLVADLEKQKELVEEIKFVRKMTPIITSLAAAQTNGHGAKNGCSDSPIMYEAVAEKPVPNDCNNLFLEENKNEEAKHGLVAKLDAEVQVDFEPNNNASSSPSPDKSAAELTSKVEEITRLRENIRRLEDIKEKQSLDISLLKKKLEMTGKGPAGIDSAEEATKLARARIREVVGEKEAAENNARYFMKEIKSLQHNVRDLHENKIYLQGRINELEGLNAEINDELSSVRKSYDAQLSQMSDLVIELNKKIQTADAPPAKQEPIATTRSIRSLFGK